MANRRAKGVISLWPTGAGLVLLGFVLPSIPCTPCTFYLLAIVLRRNAALLITSALCNGPAPSAQRWTHRRRADRRPPRPGDPERTAVKAAPRLKAPRESLTVLIGLP